MAKLDRTKLRFPDESKANNFVMLGLRDNGDGTFSVRYENPNSTLILESPPLPEDQAMKFYKELETGLERCGLQELIPN